MYDEKIQIALFEEIYQKQGGTVPVGLDLCDPARSNNFNFLVNKYFVHYPRGLNISGKPVWSCISGMFHDDISITDDGEKHYYDLRLKHEQLALEHKNTSIAESASREANRANWIALTALIASPILGLIFTMSDRHCKPFRIHETAPIFIHEKKSVEHHNESISIINTSPNLEP